MFLVELNEETDNRLVWGHTSISATGVSRRNSEYRNGFRARYTLSSSVTGGKGEVKENAPRAPWWPF